ncbi:DUF4087 domain-containing protein [Rhodanobacter sp. Col0626]|uniref:DUF4087 domain-containing protein n=1 Tax=Rhodanobacter sp. Col0626 TaxID=3415679 RepID=UPI003CF13513
MRQPSLQPIACLAALLWIALAPAMATNPPDVARGERRCGWFENPTPGNATLTDRDGEWEIAAQGGHEADGDWPDFTDAQWVPTHGHHGYGCACLTMRADPATHLVASIGKATARPLATCRGDRSLREPPHAETDED